MVAIGPVVVAGIIPAPMAVSSPPSVSDCRQARVILGRLKKRYPAITTALDYVDPWQLLVATVLSAQTTDENVNKATPGTI